MYYIHQKHILNHLLTYLVSQVLKNIQNGYIPLLSDKNNLGTQFSLQCCAEFDN